MGTRRVDFLVAEKVMVELKAISHLENIHLAQGLNYLEAYQLEKTYDSCASFTQPRFNCVPVPSENFFRPPAVPFAIFQCHFSHK